MFFIHDIRRISDLYSEYNTVWQNEESLPVCEAAVCVFAEHLLEHCQVSTCLQVERKVQRLISQI